MGEVPIGGGMTDGGSSTNGAQTFTSMITPLVNPRCTGCHGGVTPPNLTSFAALQDKYKMKPGMGNILVIKGDATAGAHEGITYFSATDKTTVATWIDSL